MSAVYRREQLGAVGTEPYWGVRRPDGEWLQSMGQPQVFVTVADAERTAAERNREKGLVPPGS